MSEIDKKYAELGGPSGFLGNPTTNELACSDEVGRFRHYQHGSIHWHPNTGAHEVHGLIRNKWATLGWEKSSLGYPKTDERSTPGGRYSLFQRGVVLWKEGAPEAFEVHGAIRGPYIKFNSEKGFLGYPNTDELKTPDGIGRFNNFEHGSIHWHPNTGAHEVHGLIRNKWATLGWERSFLGYPKTDESDSGGGAKGRFNLFQGGAITWKQGAKEAFETHGAIRSKFGQMGWEAGFLGFPTTDETRTPDGVGRFNHFEGGSVYWKPSISAHEVHGLIGQYWANHGWETNPELGYPISDETPTYAGSKHRFSDFENGVVYWKHGAAKAVSLTKFPVGSQTADQVVSQINGTVVKALKSNSRVYIKNGPSLAEVTGYSWDGSQVRNRLYRIHVGVGIDISGVPDPTSNLDFWIEIAFDRAKGTVWASLHHATFHTHVPWPTSMGVSASDINAQYKAVLDPMVGVPQDAQTVPDEAHLLSAKVMPNGDLNVYLQPLFDK